MQNKLALSLTTTAQALTGGVDAVQGIGQDDLITCGTAYNVLSYNLGDLLTLQLTDQNTGYQTQIGAGYVTGYSFNFCMTFNNKVYGLSGGKVFCSAIGQPTIWNDPNALGNGFVQLSNWFAVTESLTAAAPFQGKLAFFSRNTTQIWNVNADINNWSLSQVLQNIGTIAPLSVQGLGELDVLFLHDSGIRSLRVRYADLNATSNDIGSAIEQFVTDALLSLTDAQKATACGVIEPSQNRYWCFVPSVVAGVVTGGQIYVLSYFPSNKIVAWSRYNCTDNNGTAFIPIKFVVYKGQVIAFSATAFYTFGGADNNTYDATVATLQVPFFDEKRPGHKKYALAIDADVEGSWEVKGSPDWINNSWDDIGALGQATFDNGNVGFNDTGSHFSFQFLSSGSTAATVSSVIFHYNLAEESN